MPDDIVSKTSETAELYFKGVSGEMPYELWKSFDRRLAEDLSLFITGQMYSREVVSHPLRQMVTVAARIPVSLENLSVVTEKKDGRMDPSNLPGSSADWNRGSTKRWIKTQNNSQCRKSFMNFNLYFL